MRPTLITFLHDAGFPWLARHVPEQAFFYLMAFGVLAAAFVIRARKAGLSRPAALEITVAGGVGALIGARMFFLVTTGAIVREPFQVWFNSSRGTASWGAYLGAMVAVFGYARATRLDWRLPFDAACWGVPLAELVGRWACLFAGDDFGRVTTVPWAIRYPAGSLAHRAHVEQGLIGPDALTSLPVHPMPVYLMINAVIVFLLVRALSHRSPKVSGRTFATYLIVAGIGRFVWEFWRDPAAGGADGLLSLSQVMCLGYLATGMVLLTRWRTPRSVRSTPVAQGA